MKKRSILTVLLVLLIAATLAFIWGNSLESIPVSSAKSNSVLDIFKPFLEIFFGAGNVTDHTVRKIAHFTEFGTLGAELSLLAVLLGRYRVQLVVNALFAGLCAAVTDEALQLLSSRGSLVSDVLLDFTGVATGVAVVTLVYAAVRSRRKAKTDNKK
jgi:VanZ family protein